MKMHRLSAAKYRVTCSCGWTGLDTELSRKYIRHSYEDVVLECYCPNCGKHELLCEFTSDPLIILCENMKKERINGHRK